MDTAFLSSSQILQAAELLLCGEVVAFPTETVYGLGALIFNEPAIRKIFIAKNRPQDNPLIAHLSSMKQLERIVCNIPRDFYLLAEAFMPGPLTVILNKHPSVPAIVSGGLSTIGVRFPSSLIAKELIEAVNQPLVAPSANLSGSPSATRADHVLDDLRGRIAAVIDGGTSEIGIESTVLLLSDPPQLLRPGTISSSQIEDVLKRSIGVASKESGAPILAPGMKYRHYAPQARVKIFIETQALLDYLSNSPQEKTLVLSADALKIPLPHVLSLPLTIKDLYANFRLADQLKCQQVLVLCSDQILSDAALVNRLSKAVE